MVAGQQQWETPAAPVTGTRPAGVPRRAFFFLGLSSFCARVKLRLQRTDSHHQCARSSASKAGKPGQERCRRYSDCDARLIFPLRSAQGLALSCRRPGCSSVNDVRAQGTRKRAPETCERDSTSTKPHRTRTTRRSTFFWLSAHHR